MRAQLLSRFSPVLTERAASLLDTLLANVEQFSTTEDGEVICQFPESAGDWRVLPPLASPLDPTPPEAKRWAQLDARIRANAPAPFQRFLTVCAGMCWGEVGETGQVVLGNGFEGTLDALGADALDEDRLGVPYRPEIFSPIDPR